MACVFKSVTLQPGESYVLPPGATIVGATSTGSIVAQNDCVDLDNIEEAECYAALVAETNTIGGITPRTPYYQDVTIEGIRIDGTNYPFTGGPLNVFSSNSASWITAIEGLNLGISNIQVDIYVDNNGVSEIAQIVFKSFPSIAGTSTNRKMSFYGTATDGNTGLGWTFVEYTVTPYADKYSSPLSWPICV